MPSVDQDSDPKWPPLYLPFLSSGEQNSSSYFIFLGNSTRIFANFERPRATNPPSYLGRQVHRCQPSMSQGRPSPLPSPAQNQIYAVHTVSAGLTTGDLRTGSLQINVPIQSDVFCLFVLRAAPKAS